MADGQPAAVGADRHGHRHTVHAQHQRIERAQVLPRDQRVEQRAAGVELRAAGVCAGQQLLGHQQLLEGQAVVAFAGAA